jgi:hypothetical protein
MRPRDHLLGHYRFVHCIGSGRRGEVYLTEDMRINRLAIKRHSSSLITFGGRRWDG